MKDIAIYGAGGFGREVACLIRQINDFEPEWSFIGFFDDKIEKGTSISNLGTVLGGMDEINTWTSSLSLVITIGNPASIQYVAGRITNPNVSFPNIIHPSFTVSDPDSFEIGIGNIITGDCAVTVDVKLGNFNVMNGSVVMGHDVKVGNFNVIMPAVRVSGSVTIGDRNLLGVGSIVLQQIRIGNDTVLGAGAVLMTKPKEGGTYLGNPAKLFKY